MKLTLEGGRGGAPFPVPSENLLICCSGIIRPTMIPVKGISKQFLSNYSDTFGLNMNHSKAWKNY